MRHKTAPRSVADDESGELHGADPRRQDRLSAAQHRAKEQLLTQAHPSRVARTTDAVVLEEGGRFLLTDASGDVPFGLPHALGLYFEDCRFLNGYVLALSGTAPVALSHSDVRGFETLHHLANPELEDARSGETIPANTIAIRRHRVIHEGAVHEQLSFRNHGASAASFRAELCTHASFEDIFVVKRFTIGSSRSGPSTRVVGPTCLEHARLGRDGVRRRTLFRFAEPPSQLERGRACFDLELDPGASHDISLSIVAVLDGAEDERGLRPPPPEALEDEEQRWEASIARVSSSRSLFDRVLRRAVLDLRLLQSSLDGKRYFAAGIPWFATLFGRDAAIVALQTLPYGFETARDTLRLLAKYQATTYDAFRDGAPGKILHELRRGELARLGTVPQSPAYYGSVDATMLFLILLSAYVRWSGDTAFARELRPNVDLALEWMAGDADSDGDGFLDYSGGYENGLVNQGWKDSGNAIVDADGSFAEPPVALCEVQGYAYRAWRDVAALWRDLGSEGEALVLDERARELQERFERDFWSDDLGCYVLARHKGGRTLNVVTSNAGQVLWSGIARPERAARVVERLLAPDMFSGWGIRTFSADARPYNPMSYHVGSVWPHDNALIVAGFRRYGHDEPALQLFDALFAAASWCRNYRLPELFCGYPRSEREGGPVPYPVACSPQAWAAGALPYALWNLLGLSADAARGRLMLRRPRLPRELDALELRNLRIGRATVDLRLKRSPGDGGVEVDADVRGGEIEVIRHDQLDDPSAPSS